MPTDYVESLEARSVAMKPVIDRVLKELDGMLLADVEYVLSRVCKCVNVQGMEAYQSTTIKFR